MHYFTTWVNCFIIAMLICHFRVCWQQIYDLGSAVYSERRFFSMLSLPGSLSFQAIHTLIHLLAHFRMSNLLWLNCFIRVVLVWPPHPQTNAAILVSLVGSKLFWLSCYFRAALGSPPTFSQMQYVYSHAYIANNSTISSSLLSSGPYASHWHFTCLEMPLSDQHTPFAKS